MILRNFLHRYFPRPLFDQPPCQREKNGREGFDCFHPDNQKPEAAGANIEIENLSSTWLREAQYLKQFMIKVDSTLAMLAGTVRIA
jgi:hypothetical protein